MAENTIRVSLIGTDRSVGRTLTGVSRKAFILGNDLQRMGASLTRNVTLPIVALGAASVIAADKVDQSYDIIRSGTGATGEKLEGLKKTFEDVAKGSTQSLDETAQAIADLNTRLGLSGPALNTMARRFLELSRITKTDVASNIRLGTRLFGDWSIKTGEQVKALDMLYRTTQQTGVGLGDLMETVVKFGAPLRNLGFDFESSIAMLGKWEKEGVNVETALTGMRFALKKFASEGKDPLIAMGEAIEQIKELPKLKALAIGKETFGLRAFSDVVAAIREGRFEYDDLIDSIKGGSDTIQKAAGDTLSMSEKLAMLRNRLTIVGASVGEKLIPVIEDLAGYVERAAEWFDNLSDSQKDFLVKAAGAATILGPMFSILGGGIKVVVRLATAYKAVAKWAGLAAAAEKAVGGGKGVGAGKVAGGLGKLTLAGGAAGAVVPVALVAVAAGATIALTKSLNEQQGMIRRGIDPETGQPVNVGTRRWGRGGNNDPSFGLSKQVAAVRADLNRGVIGKLTIQAQNKTGPAFLKVIQDYQTIKELTEQGIELKIDKEKPLESLQSIQARIMDTGQTAEQATKTMERIFGKDVVAPLRKHMEKLVPTMEGVSSKVKAKHTDMANKLMQKIRMPAPDASGLLNTLQQVYNKLVAIGYSASQAQQAIARAVSAQGHLKSGYGAGGHLVGAVGGGFDGPKTGYPVTMHGRETIVAHDNPTLGLQDLAKAGILGSGETVVNVYLDSEPVAARVEVRQRQRARTRNRTLGLAPA